MLRGYVPGPWLVAGATRPSPMSITAASALHFCCTSGGSEVQIVAMRRQNVDQASSSVGRRAAIAADRPRVGRRRIRLPHNGHV